MQRRKITEGTRFIVFDMEWNQPIPGKHYDIDVSTLPGEIIEIGAVSYVIRDGVPVLAGNYSCDIRPHYYNKIHYHVKKVTGKTNADLRNGTYLESAYRAFREFCGEDAILVGWGTSDPDMLKKNLKARRMNDRLGMMFVDIQPIFSVFAGDRGHQRSVEYAVDYYGIEKNETFHSAMADAEYTGEILRCIYLNNDTSEVSEAISRSVTDPDIRHEYPFVTPEVNNADEASRYATDYIRKCPRCDSALLLKIGPFRLRKSVYAMGECETDGEFFARARIKKGRNGGAYASAIMRIASPMDQWLIEEKKSEFDEFGVNGKPHIKPSKEEETPSEDDESVNVNDKNE